MYSQIFINNLNRYMRAKKMTRKELSLKTGISYSTLAGYFCNGITPKPKNMDLIADALKIHVSALFKDGKKDHLEILELLNDFSEEDEQLVVALCREIKKGGCIHILFDKK